MTQANDLKVSEPDEIADRLQQCGVAGAGGAGFPAHVKWQDLDSIDNLLINLQEGEPVFYGDKWLVTGNLDLYRKGLEYLLEEIFSTVIIATKSKYREKWFGELENILQPEIITEDELPVNIEETEGLHLAYTKARYELSQEPALLWTVAGLQLNDQLPTEKGWIVQNTETVYNIIRAIFKNKPVINKQVAVFGPEIEHTYFEVPVGTPAVDLLNKNNVSPGEAGEEYTLLDGGPGWCCEINTDPQNYGISKRTNGIMVVEPDFADRYRDPNESERINALDEFDWDKTKHQTEPVNFSPQKVRIPLISNPCLEGIIHSSCPVVEEKQKVQKGEVIARPAEEGMSNYQHSSIDGTVKKVTKKQVVVSQ